MTNSVVEGGGTTPPSPIGAPVRFDFGENWANFVLLLDEARIADAVTSLQRMLGRDDLRGIRFLDAGCGSGLFSLAAQRLGRCCGVLRL
jgi:2-polyprenyl-3-methyl-5-hydroxy-6-metoxy-1,4-benzoquinol methylase